MVSSLPPNKLIFTLPPPGYLIVARGVFVEYQVLLHTSYVRMRHAMAGACGVDAVRRTCDNWGHLQWHLRGWPQNECTGTPMFVRFDECIVCILKPHLWI